jgi:predicted permease
MTKLRTKLEQNLGWAVLLLLLIGCLLVLRPFISALLWAVILCFSSWPLYQRLLRWVGRRRTVAALLMALGMVCILLVPFVIIGSTLAGIPLREVFSEKRLYPVVAAKLIVVPVLLWFVLHFFLHGGMSFGVVVAETAMPTATVATMNTIAAIRMRVFSHFCHFIMLSSCGVHPRRCGPTQTFTCRVARA